MQDGATIVACATGDGPSAARALVRLSGPACTTIERELIVRPQGHRTTFAARILLSEGRELPCLAWCGRGPRTYTGEDTLELLIPGNTLLVRMVVARLCEKHGVRGAEPGEFSARAYLSGKLSLERAEGVAAMIAAKTAADLDAAARLMRGETGGMYRAWAEEAATLLALLEAGIDFSDQEGVVGIAPDELRQRVAELLAAIKLHLGSAAGREAPSGRTRAALIGPPNAGKSTLFNALLGRVRAVATPIAGTTRDVLAEPLTILRDDGEPLEIELLDLPGLDAAASGLDALGQQSAAAALAEAQVLLHCCERGAFGPLPAGASHAAVVRVHTKADRPGEIAGAEASVCALTGGGLDTLRELIARAATRGAAYSTSGAVVARHARALRSAARSLSSVEAGGPAEVAAHHLRGALDALGEVSGAVTPDDVIGLVFLRFCVGK